MRHSHARTISRQLNFWRALRIVIYIGRSLTGRDSVRVKPLAFAADSTKYHFLNKTINTTAWHVRACAFDFDAELTSR